MALPEYIINKEAVKLRNSLFGCGAFVALLGIGAFAGQGVTLLSLGLIAVSAGVFAIGFKIETRKRKRAEGAVYN